MNDRKRQVLLIAKQIFIEKGFVSTSIQDILNESKISKGTFYNYFSSKNECLMAILEQGRDETIIRRQELLIGRSKSDQTILATQISMRLQVNREQNLLPIFEAVFYSGDAELRTFAKKHHLAELSWLTSRLIDVYGEDASPFAPDCAVLMIGMMQYMIHVWTARSKEDIDTTELVAFTMRRIDTIMFDMIKTEDRLLNSDIFVNVEKNTVTKENLLPRLIQFQDELKAEIKPANKQYIQFLIDEIKSEHQRIFLLEAVANSLRQAFIKTPHEQEVQELTACIWIYIETLNKSK